MEERKGEESHPDLQDFLSYYYPHQDLRSLQLGPISNLWTHFTNFLSHVELVGIPPINSQTIAHHYATHSLPPYFASINHIFCEIFPSRLHFQVPIYIYAGKLLMGMRQEHILIPWTFQPQFKTLFLKKVVSESNTDTSLQPNVGLGYSSSGPYVDVKHTSNIYIYIYIYIGGTGGMSTMKETVGTLNGRVLLIESGEKDGKVFMKEVPERITIGYGVNNTFPCADKNLDSPQCEITRVQNNLYLQCTSKRYLTLFRLNTGIKLLVSKSDYIIISDTEGFLINTATRYNMKPAQRTQILYGQPNPEFIDLRSESTDPPHVIQLPDQEEPVLEIKFMLGQFCSGNEDEIIHTFRRSDCPITFGRRADQKFSFNKPSVSTEHCKIDFDPKMGWYIAETNSKKGNILYKYIIYIGSLNGTYVAINDFERKLKDESSLKFRIPQDLQIKLKAASCDLTIKTILQC